MPVSISKTSLNRSVICDCISRSVSGRSYRYFRGRISSVYCSRRQSSYSLRKVLPGLHRDCDVRAYQRGRNRRAGQLRPQGKCMTWGRNISGRVVKVIHTQTGKHFDIPIKKESRRNCCNSPAARHVSKNADPICKQSNRETFGTQEKPGGQP